MPESTNQPPPQGTRTLQVILAGVIALAFVGFFVGTRHIHTPRLAADPRDLVEVEHDYYGPVIPATSYIEMASARFSPNRNWRSILNDLDQPVYFFDAPPLDERERQAVLELRASRRAYPGAPPTVPHSIDQMSNASCMACHGQGLRLPDNRIASRMPHEYLPNCTQCHAELNAIDLGPAPVIANLFKPLESPSRGTRVWPGAPPTIPHGTFMRMDCLACHGEIAHEPLRTSHPWQTNCMQCHAPSAQWDQVAREAPAFLPPPIVIEE